MTLDELLAQYQPNQEELKRQQQSALLLNVAGGLLGARRGQELQGLGHGLLGGGMAAYQVKQDAQQNALRQLQLRGAGMDYLGKEDAFTQAQKYRQAMSSYQPQTDPRASMPSLAPTQQNAQTLASAPQPGMYEQTLALADYLQKQGLPDKAMEARMAAEKYAPQYDGTETLTQDNKPVVYQKFKNRPGQVLPGLQPKPEYKEVSDGQNKFFYDPLSQQKSGSFQMQLSPGEVQTGAHQNASLAETIRNNNATKALGYAGLNQSERHFQAGQGKPQYDAERGGYVTPPGGANGPAFTPVPGVQPKDTTPASLKEKIAQNAVTIQNIDAALSSIKQNPGAVGPMNAIPGAETVRQYTDPQGVTTRALVAGIGAQRFHDLSGAAVTVSEAPRLVPYIPQPKDRGPALEQKLQNLRRETQAMQQELAAGKPLAEVISKRSGASGGWSAVEVK